MQRIFHQLDSDGNLKLLEPLPAKLPELAMELPRVARLSKSNRCAHDLSHNGVFLAINRYFYDFGHFLKNAFDFRRVHLLATDINNFRLTSEDAKILAVYLNFVTGIEPSVRRKWTWGIEISKHGGLSFYLKNSINNTGLKTFASKLHPKRIRGT